MTVNSDETAAPEGSPDPAAVPTRRAVKKATPSPTPEPTATERLAADAGDGGAAPRPGDRLGRYFVLELLGRGGMGSVYAAFDPALERRVAIKLLHTRGNPSEDERARLLTEAKAMAKLSHPNVVTVHEAAVDRGRVYLVMEYVAGRTLRAWLAERERPWSAIVAVFREAALGLAAAHAAGMIHRDVKPDNILIGNDERVRITDFGVALPVGSSRRTRQPSEPASSSSDESLALSLTTGTPAYMSPEQLAGEPLDGRSDQFSLAVTIFEALWRTRPYAARTRAELRKLYRAGVVIATPSEPAVPPWLRRVLTRALSIAPEARWPSMAALVRQLELGTATLARSLRPWLLALVPAGVVAGAIIGGKVGSDGAPRCDDDAMAEVWSDDDRRRLTVQLGGAGASYASEAALTVARLLDDYVEQWRSAATEVCVAHRDGVESDALFDRRQACLDARRHAVVALLQVFEDAAADSSGRAIEAVDALPPVRECTSPALLDDPVWTLPDRPDARARHGATVDALAAADAMFRAGRFHDGLREAESAVELARGLDDERLLPRALMARERYQDQLDDDDGAFASTQEAWEAALRSGSTVDAIAAANRQVVQLGYEQRQEAAALSRVRDAEGLIARLRRHNPVVADELESELQRAQGLVETRFGQWEAAIGHLGRAVERVRAAPDRHDLRLAAYLTSLANAEFASRRHDDALAHYRESLRLQELTYGPEHPAVAGVLNNMGLLLRNMDRAQAGRELLERAYRIQVAAFGEGHSSARMSARNLGSVLHQLGSPAAAVPYWERGLGRVPEFEEHDHAAAQAALHYADDLAAIGDDARALEILRAMIDFGATHPGFAPMVTRARAAIDAVETSAAAR
ncbi:MAG: serine/threonine protein kinase [Deltaproteobacteria bacterium]|nr:serine/threonine protein kinase [Deltaproteobacteria bacterium]